MISQVFICPQGPGVGISGTRSFPGRRRYGILRGMLGGVSIPKGGGVGPTPPPAGVQATAAVSTHPSGIISCFILQQSTGTVFVRRRAEPSW